MQLRNKTLVQVTDPDRVRDLKELLRGAKDIGYEPKTYIPGPALTYIGPDGQTVTLELDLDSDLFRYDGRFFDYGPGNDNNAIPRLWNLLELEDWPEEVKAAFPEWFESIEELKVPANGSYQRQSVYMDLWYPDWYYVKIQEAHALVILEAIQEAGPVRVYQPMVPVEDSIFTLHIGYDDGRGYDLACIGEEDFLLWECGTETVYSLSGEDLRRTVDEMIALSKQQAE